MVYKSAQNASIYDNTCPASSGDGFHKEQQGFKWSEERQGVILGAFYWGYAASELIIKEPVNVHLSASHFSARSRWRSSSQVWWKIRSESGDSSDRDFHNAHTGRD
jgi:hypothetical protein